MNKDYFNSFVRSTKEKLESNDKKRKELDEIKRRLQSREVYEYLKMTGQLEANQMRFVGDHCDSNEDIIKDTFEKYSVLNKDRDTAHIFACWQDTTVGKTDYISYQNIELDDVLKVSLDEVKQFEKGKYIIKVGSRQDFFRVQGEFAVSAFYNGQEKANEEIKANYGGRVLLRKKN